MNSDHTPNLQANGDEQGDHLTEAPALDAVPADQCIKLPSRPWWPYQSTGETLTSPWKAYGDHLKLVPRDQGRYGREPSAGPLINEAAEITQEQWDALVKVKPSGLLDELHRRISACISKEKAGKMLPLSWDRVMAISDRESKRMCDEVDHMVGQATHPRQVFDPTTLTAAKRAGFPLPIPPMGPPGGIERRVNWQDEVQPKENLTQPGADFE